MKSIQLFSSLIFKKKINHPTAKINHNLLKEIKILTIDDGAGISWSKKNYPVGYTSYGSLDRLFELSPTFLELKHQIDKKLKLYLKDLDYEIKPGALEMNTMWVNVMPKGAYHTMHIHPHSVISGTYYLQTPVNSSSLKFEDPRILCFMNSPLRKTNAKQFNRLFFEIKPKAGEVILFESWQKHEVPQNKSKLPRISISFNYDWKKDEL